MFCTIESLENFVTTAVSIFSDMYLRSRNSNNVAKLLEVDKIFDLSKMLGSIDCMHWKWKNCPTWWKCIFCGHLYEPTIILVAMASWIWNAYFTMGNDTWGTFYRPPADFYNKKIIFLIKNNFWCDIRNCFWLKKILFKWKVIGRGRLFCPCLSLLFTMWNMYLECLKHHSQSCVDLHVLGIVKRSMALWKCA